MKTFIVDSFTTVPYKGNPAAVCFPQQGMSEENMQHVATELGLSETAFVQPSNTDSIYYIRYFSPKKEIPLCGHATLAAAKVLFKNTDAPAIHFITADMVDLFIERRADEIVITFPVYEIIPATVEPAMLQALGLVEINHTAYSPKNKIIMLEINDATILARLTPDFKALLNSHNSINGVLVTAASNDEEYDFHYRYFWPWAGTDEDPVTGGVHTFLTKYWANKLGKTKMKAFQSSPRTGKMSVELQDEKVLVIGQAVIVFEGNLLAFD